MAINLKKFQPVNLTKVEPSARKYFFGAGWDMLPGSAADLDMSLALKNSEGKLTSDGDFVFYNNTNHSSGAAIVGGDNRTGEGDGYDEAAYLDTEKLPENISAVDLVLSIHEPADGVTFASVSSTKVGIHNGNDASSIDDFKAKFIAGQTAAIAEYNPQEAFGDARAVVLATLNKDANGEWNVTAVGKEFPSLAALLTDYGMAVAE